MWRGGGGGVGVVTVNALTGMAAAMGRAFSQKFGRKCARILTNKMLIFNT